MIKREKLNIHLPNMKLGKVNIVYIIAISMFLQPAMMVISALSSLLFPNEVAELMGGMMSRTTAFPLISMLLAAAVTPAICEELVFRGYIQSQYKNYTIKKAAVINGLFFGIIHMNPQQFVYAFAMGIVFALMVHYTRSIRAAILSHFIVNGSQLTLIYIATRTQEMAYTANHYTAAAAEYAIIPLGEGELIITPEMMIIFTILFITLIALFFTPCAIILFRSFISHNRARNMKYDLTQTLAEEIPAETTPESTPEISENPEPTAEQETKENEPITAPPFPIDPFSIAIVTLFLIFSVLTFL